MKTRTSDSVTVRLPARQSPAAAGATACPPKPGGGGCDCLPAKARRRRVRLITDLGLLFLSLVIGH